MDIPAPLEDGQEPPAIDEERKEREFASYKTFAKTHLSMIEEIAGDYLEFNE